MSWVTSSCLCKKLEGAVFPFQVEALEDGVDDAVHPLDVDKAHHRPGAAAYLDKAALADIGGAQLLPQMAGEAVEREQLGQIALRSPHHGAVVALPAATEGTKGRFGLASAFGPINRLRIPLHLVIVACARAPECSASCAPSSADAAPAG